MVADAGLGLGTHDEEQDARHCGEHCPFLNRSDRRCSDCLSLDRIDHAFDYCFGEYKACPVYLELLVERRVRRLCGLLTPPEAAAAAADAASRTGDAHPDANRPTSRRPLVQLTVARPAPDSRLGAADPDGPVAGPHAHRYAQHPAAAPVVPAASGL
jgi:hypothetical protein